MLQVYEKNGRWLRRLRRRPKLIAVFSFRYDWHLVPDLLSNIEPIVDGWISFDDRGADTAFSDEARRQSMLIARAREIGTGWVLAIDPDERLEVGAAPVIREMTKTVQRVVYTFRLCELYTPQHYRIDGIWAKKTRIRLFPLLQGQIFSDARLHRPWHPLEGGYQIRHLDINLYHLKMIQPERRIARAALYRQLDPDNHFQEIGYDYLADDDGLTLERIAPGREYHPAHKDNGGLWMPDFRSAGSQGPTSDSPHVDR